MSLALVGPKSSYEFRWRRWALLRDTVLMLMGPDSVPRLHEIGDGLVGAVRIPATELARDIEKVRTAFAGKSTDQLAISPKTAAVLYMGAKLDEPRLLTANERAHVAPASEAGDLASYFASMLDSIVDVCKTPHDDGCVEVLDG